MHSEVLLIASSDRLPRIQCSGGIQARCTGPDTVHLVSAAATPLGGDTITIRVIVETGGVLKLRSAAATLALPGAKTPTSHACWDIQVSGTLDLDLEPTVVAADARHVSAATLVLRDDGRIRFRERVQIGRCNEREGFWSGSLRADRNDHPLLRHRMELGAGSVADDSIAAPRATISELRYPATEFTDMPGASTVLELAGGGTLSTWQADRLVG
ncbi:urease accessory protein UreD [Mycobacterium montefiorense]|uniref:Urease accessory protein UreD n=1 Tax=Mycobacterium montefiorense TaxID=154654 RepID=A0AA37PJU4_9MYCO|nr:urease accessory protein UreD [Mycobacterium montefiorense]GBG38927.1 urease accessory protein UreD [Mycobacterium montefiorense]GKU32715.1 urease accessory protein UreD [Mycobacterium montefiorense]GKU38237.1 urease accessory protein UreD [Mycobacterium montefiorense]GKU43525.1 urease accessory protein UreD [Mycobacterium montefiorense]GKU50266.1 urease accessory protein UreD [Mycobacterium montefiorense]